MSGYLLSWYQLDGAGQGWKTAYMQFQNVCFIYSDDCAVFRKENEIIKIMN